MRFAIHRRAVGHVFGDIGDVDLQFEIPIVQPPHGDCVIEVACRLAINGNDGEVAEVPAMVQFARRDDRLKRLGLRENVGREAMRNMELVDDDLDVDTEIVFVTEDLDHAAPWILRGGGPFRDLDIDDYTFEIV